MGGGAFPNLKVPRLSHSTYFELRDTCLSNLGTFYTRVISPPESPSKADHGDIDITATTPIREFGVAEIAQALGAVANTKVGPTTSFAIPLPYREDEYAQVDIHVCPAEYFDWEVLMGSYGDLMQIIGVFNRSIGLTANDKGLHLRVPEIEDTNRKKSMLYLTHSALEMLEFLGLDAVKYGQGFSTDEEIFAWCVSGRFYGPKARDRDNESANDRNRYKKRVMFTKCMNEWLPANQGVWDNRRLWTREEVLAEALRFFDKSNDYRKMMDVYEKEKADRELLQRIRQAVQEGDKALGEVMRALKRFVILEDGRARLSDGVVHKDIGEQVPWLMDVKENERDAIIKWVAENSGELRRRERLRMAELKVEKGKMKETG